MKRFLIVAIMLAVFGSVGFGQEVFTATVADITAAIAVADAAKAACDANKDFTKTVALQVVQYEANKARQATVMEAVRNEANSCQALRDSLAGESEVQKSSAARYLSSWRKDNTLLVEMLPAAITNIQTSITAKRQPNPAKVALVYTGFKRKLLADEKEPMLASAIALTFKNPAAFENVYKELSLAERVDVLETIALINSERVKLAYLLDLTKARRLNVVTKARSITILDGMLFYLSNEYNLNEALTVEERAAVKEKARRIDSLRETISSMGD